MVEKSILQSFLNLFSCPLCKLPYNNPLQFTSCGHAFCRDCISSRLEGKGITKSECPECHQPGWRKDLVFNSKYASIAEILKAAAAEKLQTSGKNDRMEVQSAMKAAKKNQAPAGVDDSAHKKRDITRITRSPGKENWIPPESAEKRNASKASTTPAVEASKQLPQQLPGKQMSTAQRLLSRRRSSKVPRVRTEPKRKSRLGPSLAEESTKCPSKCASDRKQDDGAWVRAFVDEVSKESATTDERDGEPKDPAPLPVERPPDRTDIDHQPTDSFQFEEAVLEIQEILKAIEDVDCLLAVPLAGKSTSLQEQGVPESELPFEFTILGSCDADGIARPSKRFRQQGTPNQHPHGQQIPPEAPKEAADDEPDPAIQGPNDPEHPGGVDGSLACETMATEASLSDIDAAMRMNGYRLSSMTEGQPYL